MMRTNPRDAAEIIRALRSFKPAIQAIGGLSDSHLYLNAEAADSICYIEEWQTPRDLSNAAAAEHFSRLFGLMEKSAEAPQVRVNTVVSTHGLDYLTALFAPEEAATPPRRQRAAGSNDDRSVSE